MNDFPCLSTKTTCRARHICARNSCAINFRDIEVTDYHNELYMFIRVIEYRQINCTIAPVWREISLILALGSILSVFNCIQESLEIAHS